MKTFAWFTALVLAASSCGVDDRTTAPTGLPADLVSDTLLAPQATTSETAPSTSADAPTPAPPSVELGAASWSAIHGFGGVWIQVDPPVDQVVKVDEVSGAVTLTVDEGTGVAIGDDAVWVTVSGTETRKIDPASGEVLLTVATPDAYYVTFGADAVWVPSPQGVSRLDPVTGATTTIVVDLGVDDLEATDGAVWVTHKDEGMVSRIDTATNTVIATIETGAGAHDLAINDNGVWITNYQANTVSRIDPETNTVVATIEGVGSGVGITTGDGDVFASTRAGVISRIDPTTNEARRVADLHGWVYGLAYGDDELWATSVDDGVVYRLAGSQLNSRGS